MRRQTLKSNLVGALVSISATAAASSDLRTQDDFGAAVRDVLLRNPQIILEVFELLEQESLAEATGEDQALITRVSETLFEGLDPERPILAEFVDFACGYCKHIHPEVLALKQANPDLQLVQIDLPILGHASESAARAALAIKRLHGPDAYAGFSDAMLALQTGLTPASLHATIARLGMDPKEIVEASASPEISRLLEESARIAAVLGINGTPGFVGPTGIKRGVGTQQELIAIAQPIQ